MTQDTNTAAAPEGMFDKIEKLLAQATHKNTSEAEAEAFFAKAFQLMSKWSIDEAILSMNRPDRSYEEITTEKIENIAWSFYKRRLIIWHVVATHNHCRAIGEPQANAVTRTWDNKSMKYKNTSRPGKIRIVGFPSDIARVKLLALSLEMHVLSKSPTGYYRKQSFMDGFTNVVAARMADVYRAAKAEGEARAPGMGLALIDKDKQVDMHVSRTAGKLRNSIVKGSRNGDAEAYRAGAREGNRADIGQTGVGSNSSRKAIR